MTLAELSALPVRSPLDNQLDANGLPLRMTLSRHGVAEDDLLGYWQDDDGQWYRDPCWRPI